MPPVTRISALSSLSLALLAAPGAAQRAPEPLPIETLLSLSSAVGGETPRWSPDGDRILLGGANLRLIRVDGGAVSELPVSTGGSGHFLASAEPRWSPDGRWISYVSDRSGTPEIWLWSVEGGDALRLTGNGGRLIKGYSWSPDGRRIAFAGNRHGQYDVWTVEVPSGESRRLTDGPALEVYPAWSPDSRSVLFVRLDGEWMDHTIVEVPAGGGEERVIARDEDFFDYGEGGTFGYPLVSPDGATVVFPSYRSGWINYWAVPRSGGEPTPLAAAEADQTEGAWSPDGGGFAVRREPRGHVPAPHRAGGRRRAASHRGPRVRDHRRAPVVARRQPHLLHPRDAHPPRGPVRPCPRLGEVIPTDRFDATGGHRTPPGHPREGRVSERRRPDDPLVPLPARRRAGRRGRPPSGHRLDPRRPHLAVGGHLRARDPVLRAARLRGPAPQRARQLRLRPRLRGGQRRLLGQVRLRGRGGGGRVPPHPPLRPPGADRNHGNELRRVHVLRGGELRRRDLRGGDRGVRLLRPGHLLRGRRVPPPAAAPQGDGAPRRTPGPLPRELPLLPPRRRPDARLRPPRRGPLSRAPHR